MLKEFGEGAGFEIPNIKIPELETEQSFESSPSYPELQNKAEDLVRLFTNKDLLMFGEELNDKQSVQHTFDLLNEFREAAKPFVGNTTDDLHDVQEAFSEFKIVLSRTEPQKQNCATVNFLIHGNQSARFGSEGLIKVLAKINHSEQPDVQLIARASALILKINSLQVPVLAEIEQDAVERPRRQVQPQQPQNIGQRLHRIWKNLSV